MKKHLTLNDRILIQVRLTEGGNITEIAQELNKSKSTISREIAKRKINIKAGKNICKHRKVCDFPKDCPDHDNCKSRQNCKWACTKCNKICDRFQEEEEVQCKQDLKFPYLCNSCEREKRCKHPRTIYDAVQAQKQYEEKLSDSRKGISLNDDEFKQLDDIVSKQVKQGISVPVICHNNLDKLLVSERTIYSYIDQGLFDMNNLDLRRKVQRPYRKKSGADIRVDKHCHEGRCYEDYLKYIEENPDTVVCQMDSVIGTKGGKTLLTIFFTNCDLQLMYLREDNTAASVTEVFDSLRRKLGSERFKELFQMFLCDRGSEFTDPIKIETDMKTGEAQCRLFYCDPMQTNQKSECERNHELIRYVIPKGKSMNGLEQRDITKMMNHINSYQRKKWNGQAPIDMFINIYGK